jgi:hypothetical protein
VVYNHIDIKLHPLLVQLDGTMISALTKFFKVQKTGADVGEKRLDKDLGLEVIARAGKCFPSCRLALLAAALQSEAMQPDTAAKQLTVM